MENYRRYMNFPAPAELIPMAEEIKGIVRRRKVLLCPIMTDGSFFADYLQDAFSLVELPFERVDIKRSEIDNYAVNERKNIITPAEYAKRPGVRALVIYDDVARTGRTLAGGYHWGLTNMNDLGVDMVLLTADKDECGITHVSRLRQFEDYLGPDSFLERFMPSTWQDLSTRGLIPQEILDSSSRSAFYFSLVPETTVPEPDERPFFRISRASYAAFKNCLRRTLGDQAAPIERGLDSLVKKAIRNFPRTLI